MAPGGYMKFSGLEGNAAALDSSESEGGHDSAWLWLLATAVIISVEGWLYFGALV